MLMSELIVMLQDQMLYLGDRPVCVDTEDFYEDITCLVPEGLSLVLMTHETYIEKYAGVDREPDEEEDNE